MIEVGLSNKPVYRDGLTTNLSYAFVAVKNNQPQYNCVVYSKNSRKIKFYPNAEFWGITNTVLNGIGTLYNRDTYQGVQGVSVTEAARILSVIRGQRGAVVVGDTTFKGYIWDDLPRSWSRGLHPATIGVPAKLPRYEGPRAT